jgi:tetratricopeptide (TPR) repeat protein
LNQGISDPGQVTAVAQAAQTRGDHEAALELFRQAAALAPDHAWRLLEVGAELRELGRFEEAQTVYLDAVARNPHLANAFRGLALVARQRGDGHAALEHFRAAAAIEPENAWLAFDVASQLRDLGRLEDAAVAFRAVLAKDPKNAHSWRALALLARESGNRAEALDFFRVAAVFNPADPWNTQDAGTELRELGRLDEAADCFRAVLARDANFLHANRGLAQIARAKGAHKEAAEQFAAVARLEPRDVWAQVDLASELRELGRLDEAESAYRAAAALDPKLAQVSRGLGLIARQRGDHADALAHFQAAVRIEPGNLWLHHDVATELAENGRYEEAERILAALVEQRSDSVEAILAYAHLLRRRGPAASVVAWLEKAAAMAPDHLGAKLDLAEERLRAWRLDEAEALFDVALAVQADNVRALIGKGQVGRRRGDHKLALYCFQKAAIAPGASLWAALELHSELKDSGRRDEARQWLEKEMSRAERPILHLQIGYLAREDGDDAGARAAFARAVEIDSDFDQAQVELATEIFQQGRAEPAIRRLRDFIDAHPDNARAINALANFAEQMDDIESAVSLRRRATEIEPSNIWAQTQLAHALSKLGMQAEAEEVLRDCEIRFGDTPEIWSARARGLAERGERPAALTLLRNAVTAFPDHFELWAQLVTTLIERGAYEEARDSLKTSRGASLGEKTRLCQLRGLLAAAQWDLPTAFAQFAEGAALAPTSGWLHEWAGRSAMLRFDFEAAQLHIAAAVRNNAAHRVSHRGSAKPSQSLLGQIFDEFRLDAGTSSRLRDAVEQEDAIAALSAIVLETPGSTSAAITLLIALRRRGMLRGLDGLARHASSPIPASIAQFWDQNVPPDVAVLCEEWRSAHPNFSYRLFSRADARHFLFEQKMPAALAAFDRATEPAMMADIFRLAYLAHSGGFYIDADDRCLAPLSAIDHGAADLLLYQEEYIGSTGNNFIGVRPGHPVIVAALEEAVTAVNRGDSDILWLSTGPGVLTRQVANYLASDLKARLETTMILRSYELERSLAVWALASYKHTQKHWSRTTFKAAEFLQGVNGPLARRR